MDEQANSDAWHYTLELLDRVSSSGRAKGNATCNFHAVATAASSGITERTSPPPATAHFVIVERRSNMLITVCYRDPTMGCYGEQCWKLGTARRSGICALNGTRIKRGDPIYRPLKRGHTPFNASWMMLATAVSENNEEDLRFPEPTV